MEHQLTLATEDGRPTGLAVSSGSAFGRPVEHVAQKHTYGCVVAALAMVLGVTYDAALSLLSPDKDPDWNHGFDFMAFDSVLVDHGYAVARKFRYTRDNAERQPWPPQPWGELHMALVRCTQNTSHAVVMLADGTILDPLTPTPRKLSDYVAVDNVAAITPLSSLNARLSLPVDDKNP